MSSPLSSSSSSKWNVLGVYYVTGTVLLSTCMDLVNPDHSLWGEGYFFLLIDKEIGRQEQKRGGQIVSNLPGGHPTNIFTPAVWFLSSAFNHYTLLHVPRKKSWAVLWTGDSKGKVVSICVWGEEELILSFFLQEKLLELLTRRNSRKYFLSRIFP